MTAVYYALGVLFVALGVAVSIGLHEIGHLVPAKKFGVKVTQYMVGFGPTIWSRRRGETEYGIKWIPLGGYIRMIGMFPPKPGDDPRFVRDAEFFEHCGGVSHRFPIGRAAHNYRNERIFIVFHCLQK